MEGWQLDLASVRSRMYLAPTPRERERWHALWLLCRGLTASGTAHTGPGCSHHRQLTGGPAASDIPSRPGVPPRAYGGSAGVPEMSGIEMANWNRQFVSKRFGIGLAAALAAPLGVCHSQEASVKLSRSGRPSAEYATLRTRRGARERRYSSPTRPISGPMPN